MICETKNSVLLCSCAARARAAMVFALYTALDIDIFVILPFSTESLYISATKTSWKGEKYLFEDPVVQYV